jgi:predicted ribosome quality control (RQC) complex YloA/Tae2 family protein
VSAPNSGRRGDDATGRGALDDLKPSTREITTAADELRQLIARADALASTTDEQFSRIVVLQEGSDRRGFRRLAHLVELTASAVVAAADASDKLIAAIERTLPSDRM